MGLLCCFKRRRRPAGSETGLPSRIADPQQHFLQPTSPYDSKLTLGSIKIDQEAHDLRDIFSPPGDVNERGRPLSVFPTKLMDASTRTKTNSSLSVLSARLRKRFSKDSNLSKHSSGVNKLNVSEEETERRRELKRALHERVRTEIFQDGRESRAGCDPDAQLIATPATVSSLNQCDIAISPSQLNKVMRRLDFVGTENVQPPRRDGLRKSQTARAPLRDAFMVNKEGSHIRERQDEIKMRITTNASSTSVDFNKSPVHDTLHEPTVRKRYTVADLRPRKQRSRNAQIHDSSYHERRILEESPIKPTYIEIDLSPDLLPLRLPSISAASEQAVRLSQSWNTLEQQPADNVAQETHDIPGVHTISEGEWLRGPSLTMYAQCLTSDTGDKPHESYMEIGRFRDPLPEEMKFGRIDGEGTVGPITSGAPREKQSLLPIDRREMSKTSSTRGSSTTSPLISRTSLTSASGKHQSDRLQHRRESSQGKVFFQGSFNTVHREQRSSSIDEGSTGSTQWLPVVRDCGSSVYPSQAGSPVPSPNGSFIRPTSFIDRLKNLRSNQKSSPNGTANSSPIDFGRLSVTTLDCLEAEKRRRGTIATTSSFHSSTDSFRARELAASEVRIISRSKTDSSPRQSRFKEDIDLSVDIPEEPSDLLSVPQNGPPRISMDGSEDWYNSGRRFAYLPGENAVAADCWERALRQTAEQNALVNRRYSSAKQSSKSFQSQLAVYEARKRLSLMSTADTNFLTVEPRRNRHSYRESVEYLDPLRSEPVSSPDSDQSPAESPHGHSTRADFDLQQSPESSPKKHADSWTRFPSHSRAARCFTPAGAADNVKSYDFALDHPVIKPQPKEISDSKAKTKSMHFGKAFKSVGNLYKSTSMNLSRFEHGYRSSISAGGILKYPELEIPQPLAPSVGSIKEQRFSLDSAKSLDLGKLGDGAKSEESLGDGPRNARVWSRMYEECVEWPMSSEAGSVDGSPMVKDRRGMSRSCG